MKINNIIGNLLRLSNQTRPDVRFDDFKTRYCHGRRYRFLQ